jgi:hypothetical protein
MTFLFIHLSNHPGETESNNVHVTGYGRISEITRRENVVSLRKCALFLSTHAQKETVRCA